MSKKIRVGIINYLNVKPLLYGIRHNEVMNEIELIETFPAKLAQMLRDDEVDIGIVPVAALPEIPEHYIVSDYCIGCDGPVASVCLFSEVPVNRIRKVLLDYHSRTSVALTRILLKHYWNISPVLEYVESEDYRSLIRDTTAGVVIGDRAFEQRIKSSYIYDLGEIWKEYTGRGFVFATWAANKKLPEDFLKNFNEANAFGLRKIEEVVRENPYPLYDLNKYYRYNINYEFDDKKRADLEIFLSELKQLLPVFTTAI
ncbi:MAG: menaquinone biosynthesis protein [Bacteroidetes bacterium]|nr:menaquinone biosynthesis protein [Bacteroidota bacterium]